MNPPGGAGFRDSMQHSDAVKAVAGMNLGGIATAARKKHTATAKPFNHAPGADNGPEPKFDENEEIPF